ncbi:LysE family translocator [Kiloniella sp.]|uniref:LysE family translocator n=1 Tax=Kiloniella sp. TaxID=1938587 RepID=UPI003B02E890
MGLELWLAFIVADILVSITPGPSVLMVTGQALTRGLPAALLCILGDILGGIVLMTLALFGVGALLATSAVLFQFVKWGGVCYMAYLGYRQIMDARKSPAPETPEMSEAPENTPETKLANYKLASMRAGFFTGVLNPKAIIFYMAFLSQFMDPTGNTLLQFTILVATSTVVVGLILTGYALAAARARKTLQSHKARKRFGYAGGGFLIGGSVLMASTR